MKEPSYHERDYAFGQQILTVRTKLALTQIELAQMLGVGRRTVINWEGGLTYPTVEHLKHFMILAIERQAFPAGHEAEEVRTFWHAAHQKVLLDEAWLTELQSRAGASQVSLPQEESEGTPRSSVLSERRGRRLDWGYAPAETSFYGRAWERDLLMQWVIEERCRVVSVLGQGGIGKSALATQVMHRAAQDFEVVIWRSLRDVSSCAALLDDILQVLAPQALSDTSSLESRKNLLLDCFRSRRVLLVYDNLESFLQAGEESGHMNPNYEGFAQTLRLVAETEHQSCWLLTSREKLVDLVPLEGDKSAVRSLHLARLDAEACQQLLIEKGITGSTSEQTRLINAYAGNPLALKIIARTIVELFDGQIAPFLSQGEVVFGGVRALLDEQYARLSAVEQSVLFWLTILRELVNVQGLQAVLGVSLPGGNLLEAMESLRHRSLIEPVKLQGSFTLQSVVMDYMTARLITEITDEIIQGRCSRLIEHGLELAPCQEYVRQSQQRLLVVPLLTRLRSSYPKRAALEKQLVALLSEFRSWEESAQGYGPANLLALLRELRGHLCGLDLSQLFIRGASLAGVELQDTTLAGATLRECTFTEGVNATRAVAISCDGRYFAAGSWRGNVQVWQQGGKHLHLAWQAHTSTLSTLAFSPDGRTLATGSWDGALKLWDMENGELLWASWRTNAIQTLAFAPNGQLLASGGNDATVQLWDTQQGTHVRALPGQSGAVYTLVWSPDGHLLASGGMDGSIRVWKFAGAQPTTVVRSFTGHTDWVFALAFAPDGRTLASGSFDRTVKLWDVGEEGSLSVRETLTGHTDWVRAVAWSSDGHILASGGFDQAIWLWESDQARYRMRLHEHTAAVHGLAFTPDGSSLLSGSDDGTLRVWEVGSGQCAHILQGYAVSFYDVAWSPDGTQLASAGSDALVTLWNAEGRTPSRQLRGHRWIVHGVAWSPDGQLLASCGWDNAIWVWDTRTGTKVQFLGDPNHVDTYFYGVTWSPDGKFLASGSYQRGIGMWEVATGTCRWVGQTPPTIIRRVEWSPDGTQLASCSDEGNVCLWDASDGQLRALLQEDGCMLKTVAWSPDGTRLASGGGGQGKGEIFVWDVHRRERLSALGELSGIVYALAWEPNERVLISGENGTLRWWDVQRGECIRMCKAHQGIVQSLKISADGTKLASCGDDGAIMLWDLHSGQHLQTLRRDRPYERLTITGIKGLSEVQKATFHALGAIDTL